MIRVHVQVRSDVWERRGKRGGREGIGQRRRRYNARLLGSVFRPHGSEGEGNVRNRKWAKGQLMRGRIKLSG